MSKAIFRFLMPDGSVESNTDFDYLSGIGMTDEFIQQRQQQEKAFLISEIHNERKWRNNELNLTDRLLFSDSTFNGVPVKECFYLDDIMAYRKKLKDYDLLYSPRPERPDWFKRSK